VESTGAAKMFESVKAAMIGPAGMARWRRFRSKIVRLLQRDTGLRVISLLVAVALWAFVNASQRGAVESLRVPISYRSLPPGYVIVNQHPDFASVEVTGPRTLLSLLDPDRMAVRLNLSGVTVGAATLRIGPEMFNVPRQTVVTRVTPSVVALDIDRVVERTVTVHPALHGVPAVGYHVEKVDWSPQTVTIRGPSRFLAHIDRVHTAPIEIGELTSDLDTAADLVLPNDKVALEDAQAVTVKVAIAEVISEREFRSVPVDVRISDLSSKFRVDPGQVNVTVRGPQIKLSTLELKGLVYIEADGIQPGAHRLPVEVALPGGFELVRSTPEVVRLRMYRERRAAGG